MHCRVKTLTWKGNTHMKIIFNAVNRTTNSCKFMPQEPYGRRAAALVTPGLLDEDLEDWLKFYVDGGVIHETESIDEANARLIIAQANNIPSEVVAIHW
jgi:hypothetical protein